MAVGLGAIIGAGIFVVTGVAAGVSGASFIVGLMIAGIVASFNGLSSAQLAAVYPQSGGTYECDYRLLNPSAGFSAGWMFILSKLSAAGIVAIGFGSYLHQLLPFASPMTYSIAAVALLTIANLWGIQKAGIINILIVFITLASLVYFVVAGIPDIKAVNFQPFAPFGLKGIAESSAILFFCFYRLRAYCHISRRSKRAPQNHPAGCYHYHYCSHSTLCSSFGGGSGRVGRSGHGR